VTTFYRAGWKALILIAVTAALGVSAGERPRTGDIVRLMLGQSSVIEMALTAAHYGEFTQCMDKPGSIHCVAGLVDTRKIILLPRGTRVRVLAYRENAYHARVLAGELVQVRILDGGPFHDKSMWTLENRISDALRDHNVVPMAPQNPQTGRFKNALDTDTIGCSNLNLMEKAIEAIGHKRSMPPGCIPLNEDLRGLRVIGSLEVSNPNPNTTCRPLSGVCWALVDVPGKGKLWTFLAHLRDRHGN
jgi:hypothetical protein